MLVKLYRDAFDTPWGFRLQGGKDLNQVLVLQRVFSNSPAEGELQRGDIILSINGRDAGKFTHKQAQDAIKFAGGQIELNIKRPAPGRDNVKPLQPTSPTRAPSNLVFNRRKSDTTHSKMPAPPIAGHHPRKITMNKFGGGSSSFGQSFTSNKKSSTAWQPVSGPQQQSYGSAMSPASPPQSYYQQPQYQQQQQQYKPPQQQYQSPPQQQYQPPPQQYQPPPQQYQPPPQQYQPPPQQQQQQYIPTFETVGDLQPDYVRAEDPVPEEEYECTSVRDLKQQFTEKPAHQPQIKRGKKKFVKPVSAGYESFGTDYSKGRPLEPEQQQRFPQPPPPRQIPINRAPSPVHEDAGPKPWQGTLKSEGLKPWEREDREYIMPSQLEAMKQRGQQPRQKRPAPAVSPKPKPATQHQIKVAPVQQNPPVRQISVRSVNNDETEDGPKAVHLQYNSPMGLYSRDNIDQTYQAQIQGQPEETSSTVSKPGQQQQQQQGDRDWNQSYVYKMVKEETKRETQTYPGKSPITTKTYSSKTYQTGQPPSEEIYGISDF